MPRPWRARPRSQKPTLLVLGLAARTHEALGMAKRDLVVFCQ